MNILMVTERYIPIWGGAENQLRQLAPYLVKRGCRVEIVTRRWHKEMPSQELISGVMVYRIGFPGTSLFAKVVFISSLFLFMFKAGSRIDIYHSHGAVNMGGLCALIQLLRKKKNVAKIASAGRIPRLLSTVPGRFSLCMFKHSSAIISMTREIDQELQSIKTSKSVIYSIPNGVDCRRFHPSSSAERQEWRVNNKLPSESLLLLFSSRLVFGKGLDILIDAWARIVHSVPEAFLLIVGSGANQPDSVEEEMRQKIVIEKLKNVRFLGETQTPEDFLSMVDFFIFPSRKEGFPNALMEAMASRLPCIASKIGGVEAIITDNENGLLFESENSDDLANKCIGLIQDREKREYLGGNARRHMLTYYSFEAISEKYIGLYKSLGSS
ncbi:glycosyltransferase family 4 protein [Desulforhopalus sp. IMCC35007]|uniref:glycosyltransferase family 4 protein n=1 Tax=Desulforhopalus sp. IMCC35007 TaxID=2569543 RepID=UPI0010AE25E0|nr:glycosyltransferase family 4 protein [Desulforhopalus sp. IMCC35007]TKB06001.1 glycosyltransferase family 4 protein [Desulforhopalus sp. IMCC35007]